MVSAIRSTIIQNTWNHLSKEKVILAAIAAIAIFALYKTYKLLVGRIERISGDLDKTTAAIGEINERIGKLETAQKEIAEFIKSKTSSTTQSSNLDTEDSFFEEGEQLNSNLDSANKETEKLKKTTQEMPQRIEKNENPQEEIVGLEKTGIENSCSDDDDCIWHDAPGDNNLEGESSQSPRSYEKKPKSPKYNSTSDNKSSATKTNPIPQFQKPTKSNKETFSDHFPGRNQRLSVQGIKTTLADVFLETVLRFAELESIAQSESVIDFLYILTYKEDKTVVIQDLPPELWKKFTTDIANSVRTLLSSQPKIQLSDKLRIRFIAEKEGRKIEFDEKAVTLSFGLSQAKGHLKSIWISDEEKSGMLIEFEHSVPATPISASVSSVEFAQLILSLFKK
ncbi:MAG TPA: hypothetical protein VFU89_02395 [Rhabdochlamydiaceae bacterium]|nr:hypothetical protein [Rhabdochlamydiaceae bacterium]